MKKILYIAPHRFDRSPGQRFRFELYMPYLIENGFTIKYSNILSEKDDLIFYSKGKYLGKFIILLKSIFKRFIDLLSIRRYSVVIIYREAFMLGTIFFERLFKFLGAKIIYDFDDAIWLNEVSDGNSDLNWLKNPDKTRKIISLSKSVMAGNNYLADYARKYCKNVFVCPTTINTDYHVNEYVSENDKIYIGWTGTSTTIKHFETIIPILIKIKNKYKDLVDFILISDIIYENNNIDLISLKWSKETEIQDLRKIDIGIMPLPDDKWSKGKCGFKGLQYMSLGIPTVMSSVGVNNEIIENNINGFLCSDEQDWINYLSILIESKDLRKNIGSKGKKTIFERYSVISQKENYLKIIEDTISN